MYQDKSILFSSNMKNCNGKNFLFNKILQKFHKNYISLFLTFTYFTVIERPFLSRQFISYHSLRGYKMPSFCYNSILNHLITLTITYFLYRSVINKVAAVQFLPFISQILLTVTRGESKNDILRVPNSKMLGVKSTMFPANGII